MFEKLRNRLNFGNEVTSILMFSGFRELLEDKWSNDGGIDRKLLGYIHAGEITETTKHGVRFQYNPRRAAMYHADRVFREYLKRTGEKRYPQEFVECIEMIGSYIIEPPDHWKEAVEKLRDSWREKCGDI